MKDDIQDNELRILVVCINKKNAELLCQFLNREGYSTASSTCIEDLESQIREGEKISLGLVDVTGFGTEIWEKIKKLQERNIPFIIIFPRQVHDMMKQAEGMKTGARAVLEKPLSQRHLLELIRDMLS